MALTQAEIKEANPPGQQSFTGLWGDIYSCGVMSGGKNWAAEAVGELREMTCSIDKIV